MTNKVAKKNVSIGKEGKANSAAPRELAFGKENYIIMLVGIAFITLGFILMYGPADGDIFSFRRITLAPIIVLIGFVIELFAIFKRPKD